jgi:hypothetical protein
VAAAARVLAPAAALGALLLHERQHHIPRRPLVVLFPLAAGMVRSCGARSPFDIARHSTTL